MSILTFLTELLDAARLRHRQLQAAARGSRLNLVDAAEQNRLRLRIAELETALREAVVVRPGDTLVIGVKGLITPEHIDQLKRYVDPLLPGVKLAVVAAEQMLVYRPSETAADR